MWRFINNKCGDLQIFCIFLHKLCHYGTCHRTIFLWGLQWDHLYSCHIYTNMQKMDSFAKLCHFLHVYAHLSTKYAIMANVIGTFFYWKSNGNIYAAVTYIEICKKCIFLQNYAILCIFLNIFAQTMPLWHVYTCI